MLMVISPAKTLDFETPPATERFTLPQYLDHSQELVEQLRELSPAQISELMHVSDKIGGLNAARFGSWTPAFTPANAKQALLAFKGDVYTGLDAQSRLRLCATTLAHALGPLRPAAPAGPDAAVSPGDGHQVGQRPGQGPVRLLGHPHQ
jgi:hypothetical protein